MRGTVAEDLQRIVMRGGMGIHLSCLSQEQLEYLQKRLTLTMAAFKEDAPPTIVSSFHIDDSRFWVPRYFDWVDFWPKITNVGWEWSAPYLDYDLKSNFVPNAEDRQPEAISAVVEHLKQYSGGIAVLPTGAGKTFISLEVARHFQTPIAVLVHKGDMIDNWVKDAHNHLGIPLKDIGIVKENSVAEGKPVTICSIQTLLARDFDESFYNQFGFVCADEIHHYAANTWSKVVGRFSARYRLGVSADPIRDDGLDPIIRWNFGKVAFGIYKPTSKMLPLVCLMRWPGEYKESKYHDWKKDPSSGEWEMGRPNAMKYAKLLAKDTARNSWLVSKIIEARSKNRRILIFAKTRNHVQVLHDEFVARWTKAVLDSGGDPKATNIVKLWGGLTEKARKAATKGDVTFTTYGFAREATNLLQKDTLVLATPAGDPLQTVGRLRDKGPIDRQSFLVIDPFEGNDYSFKKASERTEAFTNLGIQVKRFGPKKS
jgi:superfamily II DNA or RNA helicase